MKENREERIAGIVYDHFFRGLSDGRLLIPMRFSSSSWVPAAFDIDRIFAMLILACVYAWQQFRVGRAGMVAKETEEEIEKRR